jgi:DNA mismatch endonuclease (patch repair protein)
MTTTRNECGMDVYDKTKRSAVMRCVKGRDTQPELIVRKLLHRLGYRFRLHRDDLPGKPDIVLPKLGIVIFVHGCFWHQHAGCSRSERPTSNVEFWKKKLDRNMERDTENFEQLRAAGWRVFVAWECRVAADSFETELVRFLSDQA